MAPTFTHGEARLRPALAHAGWRGPSLPFAVVEAVLLGAVAVIAVILGWAIATNEAYGLEVGSLAVLLLGATVSTAVILAGPVACLAAIAAVTASGLDPTLVELGPVSLAATDVFWLGLAGWWLVKTIHTAVTPSRESRPRVAFGQVPTLAFFAYVGLTLVIFELSEAGPWVSWLRLLHTFLLAWLAASMVQTKRDVQIVLGALVLGGVAGIAIALFSGGSVLTARSGGALGKNALGLMSGFVLLAAVFSGWSPRMRYALGPVAILGLVLAKSVASFVAVGVAVAIGAALIGGSRVRVAVPPAARVALTLGVATLIVFASVQVLRPEQLPGSEGFNSGSAIHRILVGTAGLEIFERNPIVGVGWRQSSEPEVIGDREIALAVRRRFPNARRSLYPDVNPATVHNTYIQILAELGIIGFILFAAMLVSIGARVIGLVSRLGPRHPLYRPAFLMALGLVAALIWHNEAPLFGGQSETIVPVLLVGLLAAISRMTGGGVRQAP